MRRIVVKIGSSVIAPKGKLDKELVGQLVKDILSAEKKGYRVILVSSGAIACGLNALGQKRKPQDTHSLMAISSLGQIVLMDIFNNKFKKYKRSCAQILLTWDDFDQRKRFMNIRKTIDNLLDMKIIPVINENDVISYDEIRFGDNDRLSALVADLISAEQLILLSDVQGLLDRKGLVREVLKIDEQIFALAKKEDKTHTSGGMLTKLEAARIATASGIKTTIAYGRIKGVVAKVLSAKKLGTNFQPAAKKDKARKRWIAFSKKAKGKIYIDAGAKEAFLNKGKSLLGVGITKVEGSFESGDAVCVCDWNNLILGCGIINYDSQELRKQKKFEREVIHRDNFAKS